MRVCSFLMLVLALAACMQIRAEAPVSQSQLQQEQIPQEQLKQEQTQKLTEHKAKLQSAWQNWQQQLSDSQKESTSTNNNSINSNAVKQARQHFNTLLQQQNMLLQQAAKALANNEYLTKLAPQTIQTTAMASCKRMETEKQCLERATQTALEQAAKQGASYFVQAQSEQISQRTEQQGQIDIEQSFTEKVNMQASSHILQYKVLETSVDKNKVTSEKVTSATIEAKVAAKKDQQTLNILVDKYREQLKPLTFNPELVRSGKQVVVGEQTINLVLLPSGEFTLGSKQGNKHEQPARFVSVTSFYVADTEVTQSLYKQCIKQLACKDSSIETDENAVVNNLPVVNVSWIQLRNEFLPWLQKQTGLPFRLPTEIEWEYAAKLDKSKLNLNQDTICLHANTAVKQLNCDDGFDQLAPVASFTSNQFGIFDLAGNVAEWTATCGSSSHNQTPKYVQCKSAVVKGGSWYHSLYDSRASARENKSVHSQLDTLGFRLALDL